MATNTTKPTSIAIITGSTRPLRLSAPIAAIVHAHVAAALAASPAPAPRLTTLDLAEQALPFLDEPVPAAMVADPAHYAHAHTRAWSARVAPHDAFVFVTPQYNWSMPGVLKNALDFLFHEWKGKPALIVTYGGHGGGKAAEALKAVLQGLHMEVVDEALGLSLGKLEGGVNDAVGKGALSDPEVAWKEELERLEKVVQERWL